MMLIVRRNQMRSAKQISYSSGSPLGIDTHNAERHVADHWSETFGPLPSDFVRLYRYLAI